MTCDALWSRAHRRHRQMQERGEIERVGLGIVDRRRRVQHVERPIISSIVRNPSRAISSRTSSAMKKK